jgi:serine/threonine protein kinase
MHRDIKVNIIRIYLFLKFSMDFMKINKNLRFILFLNLIKPENIILDGDLRAKLCDFGWCADNINLKR